MSLLGRHALGRQRRGFAVLGGFAKALIEQEWGNTSSKMAGLHGALLVRAACPALPAPGPSDCPIADLRE